MHTHTCTPRRLILTKVTPNPSLQSLARLITKHKQNRDYPTVLTLWTQLFHTYKKAPDLGCCFSVLYACSQLRSSLAADICDEVYSVTWQDQLLQQNVVLATSVMRTLQQCKHPAKALSLWDKLTIREGNRDLAHLKWDRVTFICVLSACADVGRSALSTGTSVHSLITPNDLRHDSRLFVSLLNMYMKCGQPESALQLAEDTWSAHNGVFGDKFIFTCILTACVMVGHSALSLSRRIHQAISSASVGFDIKLFGVLALMYQICGNFDDVLDLWWSAGGRKLADEDTCSAVLLTCAHSASKAAMEVCESVHARIRERGYTAGGGLHKQLISAYYKCNRLDLVLSAWRELVQAGGTADDKTQLHVLSACASLATSDAMEVAQKLYSQCRSGQEQLYDTMLKVFIRCQQPHLALEFWHNKIQPIVSSPSKRTVMLILQACAAATNLEVTESMHSSVICASIKLQQDTVIITSLMNTYTQCNQPALALSVWRAARKVVALDNVGFTCALQACAQLGGAPDVMQAVEELVKESQLVCQDQHLLTAIMSVYIKFGTPERALQYFFSSTEQDASLLSRVTATTALTACADIGSEDSLAAGEHIRSRIADFERDIMFENASMSLYTRCGKPQAALQLWESIYRRGTLSTVSYVCAITACATSGPSELHTGQHIHSQIPEQLKQDSVVVSALIAMYLRCGQPVESLKLWKEMLRNGVSHTTVTFVSVLCTCATIGTPASLSIGVAVHALISSDALKKNEVLQNALLTMYTNCGEPKRAISLWEELTDGGTTVTANEFIRTSIFTATFRLAVVPASVKHLLKLTCDDIERGIINNEALENALLNVYAKCGDIIEAKLLFDRIYTQRGTPSINSWNTIINAYAKHRNGREACLHFERLLKSQLKPDSITFVVLLNACAHAGLVTECQQYFHLMRSKFNITPSIEHQCCVIDALARNGQPLEAEKFILKTIPSHNQNIVVWMTLLGCCRSQIITTPNKSVLVSLAERSFQHISKFDTVHAGAHVALGNIYEAVGLFKKAEEIRRNMQTHAIKKIPGKSWLLDGTGTYHEFFANDQTHPRIVEIHSKWEELSQLISYKPNLQWVLQNETVEQKKIRLCRHSEKLALCFALIVLPPASPIYIINNLRMCGDCHATTAIVSHVVGCRIVVRDSKTFHHFENGTCSCNGAY